MIKPLVTGAGRSGAEFDFAHLEREAPDLAVAWDAFARRVDWLNEATILRFYIFEPLEDYRTNLNAKPSITCEAEGTGRRICWSHAKQIWLWCWLVKPAPLFGKRAEEVWQ